MSRSWVRQTIGVSLRAPGGHSCVTHSRNQADTRGHGRTRRRSNSSTGGTARTPEDTRGHTIAPVRDRQAPGSNPGPRPFLNSEPSSSAIQRASGGHWGSQGDHKFLGEHGASSPFEVVPGPLLNSGIVIRRPIYQQTHGPWTVDHVSSKSKHAGAVGVVNRPDLRGSISPASIFIQDQVAPSTHRSPSHELTTRCRGN
jgi:hypothetical protein